jgi:hypothetical protein
MRSARGFARAAEQPERTHWNHCRTVGALAIHRALTNYAEKKKHRQE